MLRSTARRAAASLLALTASLGLLAACGSGGGSHDASASPSHPPSSPSAEARWPDASWAVFDAGTSPFRWTLPSAPSLAQDSEAVVGNLLDEAASGCDPADPARQSRCKPSNLVAGADGVSGGGWPTYFLLPGDPDVTVVCPHPDAGPDDQQGPCPLPPGFTLKMPAGAAVQVGTPDRHLTVVDRDGVSGLKKPGYEYDFYQAVAAGADPGHVTGGSISVTSDGSVDLAGIGRPDATDGVVGNTNAAGVANLAGRIRVEELEAGRIDHALSISVPCTQEAFVWPATHSAAPAACASIAGPWPRMGELLWLDLDAAALGRDPVGRTAPAWALPVLLALHEHGAYVDDNGGLGSSFFQLQTEAQNQYTSLDAADDPWRAYATAHWVAGADDDRVGNLQGQAPSDPAARTAYYAGWRSFWRQHLHVLDACALPHAACPPGAG